MRYVSLSLLLLLAACSASQGGNSTGDTVELLAGSDSQSDGPGTDSGDPRGTITPVFNQVYWTEVHEVIENAQDSLKVVHFELNHDSAGDEIAQLLAQAAARGVDVQVVLDDEVESNTARVEELGAAGVAVKLDGAGRMTHTKLVVADRSRALFGSTNWSWSSMRKNNETNVLVEDQLICGYFADYADALWNAPRTTWKQPVQVSPLGRAFGDASYVPEAMALINGAEERVDLLLYGMNVDPDQPDSEVYKLLKAMKAAQDRGVQVRIVLDWSSYDRTMNRLNTSNAAELRKLGFNVRFETPQTISHAKLLVSEKEALIGSNNWGYGGFVKNHEIGVRTADQGVVQAALTYFEGIWGVSLESRR
jgi:phosphatidylserine/phosphatidylglycerophosphate/cardiolipin synthase-like enzyme